MLQAEMPDGNLVTLASRSRTEINRLKETNRFFCPICKEPVMIKAGMKVIPHFAHRTAQNCPSQEGGEGPYHEAGKLMLYQWLVSQGIDVQLEVYLPKIKQRADLLVRIQQKRIALEYQCARIPVDELNERSKGYQQLGIQPIWIIGANHFKRYGSNQLKIDSFLSHFLHQYSPDNPLTCYFFSPNDQLFVSFQDIYLSSLNRAIGQLTFHKLSHMTIMDLFAVKWFNQDRFYTMWLREKQRFRMRRFKGKSSNERAWQQWLYINHTHTEQLPSIVYLPVATQYRMNTPLWDWQSRICIGILQEIPIGGDVSLQRCTELTQDKLMTSNTFPLIHAHEHPIYQYLQLLTQLNVLKQTTPAHFIKQRPIPFYQNVEQAIKGDKALMKQMKMKTEIKIRA